MCKQISNVGFGAVNVLSRCGFGAELHPHRIAGTNMVSQRVCSFFWGKEGGEGGEV